MKKNSMKILLKNLSRLALFAGLLITGVSTAEAQQGDVTIGAGGTGTTGAGSSVSPICTNYKYFRTQILYTKDEILAAGGAAGNISKLAWNVTGNNFMTLNSYTIKMGHTTVTSLSSHNTNATTQVYSANYAPSTGWNYLNFTTNFNWNGSDNIIIDICYNIASTSTSYGNVYTTTGTSPTNRYVQSGSSSVCATNTNYKNFSAKAQVRFYMNLAQVNCDAPTNVNVGSITGTTATATWSAPNPAPANGYEWARTTTATAPAGSGTAVTTTSVNLTGMTAGTAYYFWVRSKCSASAYSSWVSVPFTTTCNAPTLTTTPGSRCGAGSVSLGASASAGTVYWWDAATGGNLLGTGTTFNTPSISTTTTYYASAGQAMAGNNTTQLGAGSSVSTLASENPFHAANLYKAQSSNYLIRASELLEAGIGAGYITSLSLDVVSAGGALNTFYIKVGNVAVNDLSGGYANSGLNYYYGNNINGVTYQPTAGLNTFNFSGSGFYWDGTSNISIIFYWQNTNTVASSTVRYDNMTWASSAYQTFISSWSTVYTANYRPKMLINGKGLCMSGRQSAVATIDNGSYTYYRDADGDGYGDPNNSITSCQLTPPAGYVTNNSDCNDSAITYIDNDGDGYGSTTTGPCGVTNNTDCDDADNTVWQSATLYVDADGDGYTAGQQTVCYGASVPAGYSQTSLGSDCDDNNPNVHPGAVEICGNAIDDNCNGQVDETCPVPTNDNPASNNPKLNNVSYYYPNCFEVNGTTAGASASLQTGETDVWYQFIASSTAVSIRVSSSVIDAKIYLYAFDDLSTPLDVENMVTGTGTEILNFDGTTVGAKYRVAVASVGQTKGNFSMCVQNLRAPGCDNSANQWELCSLYKSKSVGATTTTFSFTDGDDNTVQTTVSSASILLNTIALGLRHNTTYTLDLTANYHLQDGAGNPEVIQVYAPAPCTVPITQHQLVEMRASDRCANNAVHLRNGRLWGSFMSSGAICGLTSFRIEFTPVDNCAGDGANPLETFSKPTNITQPYIDLNYAMNGLPTGLSGTGYWSVRWRPRFNGYEGTYGPAHVVAINGTSMNSGMVSEEGTPIHSLTDLRATVYPNPNHGEMVNLNMTGITSGQVGVRIMDATGRVIFTNTYAVDGSLNTIVNFDQQLAQGLYMVEFTDGNQTQTQRMMVTK